VMAMAPVRMALAARPTGLPIIMQLHDTEFELHGGDFSELQGIPCVSNSFFTADKYRNAFGVDSTVIYPIILASDYQTVSSREVITFVNPITVKGLDIAVEIARRCPDLPFEFVESWPLKAEQRRELAHKLTGRRNVTLRPPTCEMKEVYGKSKILLAPSIWEEAYGRVATEAQLSGIPVIASARGGLPEAVGPGGLLIDPEGPIERLEVRDGRFTDPDRADLLGFDQADGALAPQRLGESRRGHPAGAAAADDDDVPQARVSHARAAVRTWPPVSCATRAGTPRYCRADRTRPP